jgi:hypothetical protein
MTALAGAGEAAYRSGNYATAQRYLRAAANVNPQDAYTRQLLATTDLILDANPFQSHISDAERNRRITAAFAQAEKRLTECAQQTGVDLDPTSAGATTDKTVGLKNISAVLAATPSAKSAASPLASLQLRWTATKPELAHLRSPGETDLPDAIMDVVFQIEQQTASICGQPQGFDLALLLISQKREAVSQ